MRQVCRGSMLKKFIQTVNEKWELGDTIVGGNAYGVWIDDARVGGYSSTSTC